MHCIELLGFLDSLTARTKSYCHNIFLRTIQWLGQILELNPETLSILTDPHDRLGVWEPAHRGLANGLVSPGDLGDGEHGDHVVGVISHHELCHCSGH